MNAPFQATIPTIGESLQTIDSDGKVTKNDKQAKNGSIIKMLKKY